ncbi:MFS transporter [Streptomyces sp. TG1A-8]|uniref:MFS transporter n=1 Tax=Streptomyces sp. TG1A-8 TaxID=3051385 RepID=UPI00265BC4DF|nr:MFS transporter [Streptomyces sp. TG1A-8]MDO0925221.1 MFS transporter [Streptomyces sp. TG1A-8]
MTASTYRPARPADGRWIDDWRPDDPRFWNGPGRRIARRNLIWSILSEHLGFTVWTLWSVVAVELGDHAFSTDQLFWLVALPNLVGALLRVPYTFAPARFGGRNWTVASTLLLIIPAGLLGITVHDPDTPYWVFLLAAATAGVGGGNFASSMANITHFYPRSRQGAALGLNAAGGNIGVSSVQVVVPWVITGFGLAAAGLVWLPLILLAAYGAFRGMDNLRGASSTAADQLRVAGSTDTWILSVLYVGTFGSFIGYATALPLLIEVEFPEAGLARVVLLGALIGSCARPVGGRLADRWGGARVTLWNFAVMAVGALGVVVSLRVHGYPLFLGSFLLLFVTAGIGNGSIYRMIPAVFAARSARLRQPPDPAGEQAAAARGRRDSAAALGITSAIGALGGFVVNRAFGTSVAATGTTGGALLVFAGFYLGCLGLTWLRYLRRGAATRSVPARVDLRV